MSTKTIFLILGGVTAVVMILAIVFSSGTPLPENMHFDNTSIDTLDDMKQKLNEYLDELEWPETLFEDPGSTSYVDTHKASYTRDEFTTERLDRYDVAPLFHSWDRLNFVLGDASTMFCLDYDEGELCRPILNQRKRVEYQMEGDQLYVNYYVHHKNSFLYERDEWENFEFYFNTIDNKVHLTLTIATYNLLQDLKTEFTIYFVEGQSYEVYDNSCSFCNKGYVYIDLETKAFFQYSGSGQYYEVELFDPVQNHYIHYSNIGYSEGFEYYLFDEDLNVFFLREHDQTLRFHMSYVDGWDSLHRSDGNWYEIWNDDALLTDEINAYVSTYLEVSPYLFVEYSDLETDTSLFNLSEYQLTSTIDHTSILNLRTHFIDDLESLLGLYSLSTSETANRTLFNEKVLNHDDSSVVSGWD